MLGGFKSSKCKAKDAARQINAINIGFVSGTTVQRDRDMTYLPCQYMSGEVERLINEDRKRGI